MSDAYAHQLIQLYTALGVQTHAEALDRLKELQQAEKHMQEVIDVLGHIVRLISSELRLND